MKMWFRLGLLAGVSLSAEAVDWGVLPSQGYVSDFAHVVDQASRVRVEAYCGAVERDTGIEIAIVTIPSLQGEPVAEVARAIYRGMGVGQRTQGQGVLLLMAVGDRRMSLVRAGGLEAILPESTVIRELRPALKR